MVEFHKTKRTIAQLSQKLSAFNANSLVNFVLHRKVREINGVKIQLIFQGSEDYC